MRLRSLIISIFVWTLLSANYSFSQNTIHQFTEGLSIPLMGTYGREAVFTDAFFYRYAVDSLVDPQAGVVFGENENGQAVQWEKIVADDKNWFRHGNLRGGYVVFDYYSKKNQIVILEANGHSEVLVNGAWRGGDPYGYGWIQHPVELRKGTNRFIFRGGRGRLQASLVEPENSVFLSDRDFLMPDLISDNLSPQLGAIRIINASSRELVGYQIQTKLATRELNTPIPVVPPLSSRKIAFELTWEPGLEGEKPVSFRIIDSKGKQISELKKDELKVSVKDPLSKHKETFLSEIDGSVQYYSIVPPVGGFKDSIALFFSLHGASVEAYGQANAYSAKDWGFLVAPTNRRPYGFDWEDWGRLDALEVLKLVKNKYQPDPARQYLTGHSMGGHGTWQVGVSFPGNWAAIGPSAGWYSFWSYGGKKEVDDTDPNVLAINKSSLPSHTLGLSRNYLHYGIYILHGDQDDNVPVDQARFMREHLGKYHPDFAYYERPGAGHWWGNECVDWDPMFDFFKIHKQLSDRELKNLEFVTASPGISASSRMITLLQQEKALEFSSVSYSRNSELQELSFDLKNTKRFQVDFSGFDKMQPYEVRIDSTRFKITPGDTPLYNFYLEAGEWHTESGNPLDEKGPHRDGLFKSAFNKRMVFVYGTHGTKQENAWAFNKARYDAETFWYRGNGAVEIVPDSKYKREDFPDRNVILFGHQDMNSAWEIINSECPLLVKRNSLKIGEEVFEGNDLGAYFLYPMKGSNSCVVGVIAGTGLPGLKAVEQNRYFVSGSGFPDYLILKTSMLIEGTKGLVKAGFFNNQWKLNH